MRSLESVQNEKEAAISAQQYELAAEYRDQEAKLRAKLEKLEQGWQTQQGEDKPVVTAEDIAHVVAMWTGIPVMRIAEEESSRLLKMEEALHERVKGQDEAIVTVAKAVRRARAGLKDPRRPIGAFIFLGPTGVGNRAGVHGELAYAERVVGVKKKKKKVCRRAPAWANSEQATLLFLVDADARVDDRERDGLGLVRVCSGQRTTTSIPPISVNLTAFEIRF